MTCPGQCSLDILGLSLILSSLVGVGSVKGSRVRGCTMGGGAEAESRLTR